ncbi:MAG: RluA family pseudouridine synthase [Bacilli bacterium]|nr:RluA family pseudouridine synthase [Bacilli bacterium]
MKSKDLNVLYEDNHIIVVEKPCNVLSQGDSTNDVSLLDVVKDYIKVKYKKLGNVYLGLVHRLDRPVGGVMVFARSSKAASRLTKSFQEHLVDKRYLAIVYGKMEKERDEFIDYIEKGKDGNSFISPNGKKAILDYELISYLEEKNCSLVSIQLKTGRHHQIRVQFASRGHYLLGDQRYGIVDHKQISLFCYYLSFIHPVTKEVMRFQLDMPKYDYWTLFTM